MPTLQEAKETVNSYKKTSPGVFEPFTPAPGGSYYAERAQGGYELVNPEDKTPTPSKTTLSSGVGIQKTLDTGTSSGLRTVSSTSLPKPIQTGLTKTATTKFVPSSAPTPQFVAPEYKQIGYDTRRVAFLRQQAAAPARRAAIKALQRAFTSSYSSGPLRDMAIRNALQEYGSAYANIMQGAEQQAESQYAAQTAEQRAANLAEYQGSLAAAQAEFQSAWKSWMAGGQNVTTETATPTYAYESFNKAGTPTMTTFGGKY